MAQQKLPPNPERTEDPTQVEATASAQGTSGRPGEVPGDDSGVGGIVYVTRGVPDLLVRVNPGFHVNVPDDHRLGGGDFYGAGIELPDGSILEQGDEFATPGPTAHMMEARGSVEIIGVAEEGK